MLNKLGMLSIGFLFFSGSAFALDYVELSSSKTKGIKFEEREISSGRAYEAQVKGDLYLKNLENKNSLKSYSKDYLRIVETYESYLKLKSEKDDWVQYSPVLSILYPDSAGKVIIANLQIDVPVLYQAIIFSYDSVKDKYTMRDRFLKKIVDKNCERLKIGIGEYKKEDWEIYKNFVNNLGNSITFKFKNETSMTILSNCPNIQWDE